VIRDSYRILPTTDSEAIYFQLLAHPNQRLALCLGLVAIAATPARGGRVTSIRDMADLGERLRAACRPTLAD
jgi:hypothetical protein